MTTKKVSYQNKLSWLKKKGVKFRKAEPSKATVDRYYSVIKKYGANVPKDIMAGNIKRLDRKIEKEKPIATPKGKITAQEYVRSLDRQTTEDILKDISPNITQLHFNRYMKGVHKLRDCFVYFINPPQGLTINNINKFHMMERLRRVELPDLMGTIRNIWKKREMFYKGYEICGVIIYDVEDAPSSADPRGVGFTEIQYFEKYLHDMIWELVITDILRNYPDATITLRRIEIAFSPPQHMTPIDMLRYHR